MLAVLAFFGYGGYDLIGRRDGVVISVISAIGSAILAYILFWYISRSFRGFVGEVKDE